MSIIQVLLLAIGLMTLLVLGYFALSGKSPAKEGHRRLQSVRYRHSESTVDKVESQLKKAIAARKPKMHRVAGSKSRVEALAIRLERTGKRWTLSQYLYASLGLALAVTALVYLRTGAAMLSLGVGVLVGAGIPHFVVGWMVKKRSHAFNSKFPDGIDLLVRGLRSGLPVGETLGLVSTEIPGPVGEDDGAELAQAGSGGSLLGKLDFKSLLSKKEKGKAAKVAEPAE